MTHIKKRNIIAIAGAFLLFAIFAMMAMQPAVAPAIEPQATTQVSQPTAYENTNVTWSSYNSSMARNEFLNGTGAANYINAEPSALYENYISINPSHIIAPKELQNDALGTLSNAWDSQLVSYGISSSTGATASISWANVSGVGEEKVTIDITGTHSSLYGGPYVIVPSTNYSSASLEYDYLSVIYTLSIPSSSGAVSVLQLANSTGSQFNILSTSASGSYYISESLAQAQKESKYQVTFNTTAGKGYSSDVLVYPQIIIPSGAPTGTYSLTINGLALTTYPITFGGNSTGDTVTSASALQLSSFSPDIKNVTIVNSGYSEALSMPAAMAGNYTETQNQISTGDYIEETTTQANFQYPTGTDISYSGTNITMALNGILGDQIPVLDINGISYTDKLGNLTGNETFYTGAVNPNTPNNVIYQVYYTADQWNSITSPPFFLSVQGIEYYWWVFLVAVFGAIGVFAGAKNYASGRAENARAPKVR